MTGLSRIRPVEVLHNLTPRGPAVASVVPSGLNAMEFVEPALMAASTRCRVFTFHTTTSPPAFTRDDDCAAVVDKADLAAATVVPSGLNATASTFIEVNGAPIAVPVATFHSLKPSAPPDASMVWSGLSDSGPGVSDEVDGEAKKATACGTF